MAIATHFVDPGFIKRIRHVKSKNGSSQTYIRNHTSNVMAKRYI